MSSPWACVCCSLLVSASSLEHAAAEREAEAHVARFVLFHPSPTRDYKDYMWSFRCLTGCLSVSTGMSVCDRVVTGLRST